MHKNGSTTWEKPDKTMEVHTADGAIVTCTPDGECSLRKENGEEFERKSDGDCIHTKGQQKIEVSVSVFCTSEFVITHGRTPVKLRFNTRNR